MIKNVLKGIAFVALFLGGNSPTWAQESGETVTVTIAQSTGSFTQSNKDKTWAKEWTSTSTEPQVRLNCANNNMAFYDGENLRLFTNKGQQNNSASYTLTPSEGWAVKSYSFDFTADTESGNVSITIGDQSPVVANGLSNPQSVSFTHPEGVRAASFTVSRSGNSDFARTSKFVVTLIKKEADAQQNVMISKTGTVPYRIPALAVAGKSGHLIAVGDYRHSHRDIGYGRVDLHISRSEDNGASWTQPADLLDKNGNPVAIGNSGTARNSAYGDPAIVGDSESDSILLLSVSGHVPLFDGRRANPNPVARWYSPDGGKTWSKAEDITEHIYKLFDGVAPSGYIDSMFFGSGRIFQSSTVKVGSHYRVYAALSGYVFATRAMACWVLYSDDFGKNWKVLGDPSNPPVPTGGDEPKVEELPNGSILISARAGGGRNYNIYTFSDVAKAEGVWGEKAFSSKKDGNGITASSNACNGEVLMLPVRRVKDQKKMFLMLQSVPFGPNGRTKVGINFKELATPTDYNTPYNFARGWDGTKVVTELGSAYSTMVLQKDETVGFFYEEETFVNTTGGGYTLVYKNYTVEDITDGAYTYDATATRPAIDPNLANAIDINKARKVAEHKGVGYPAANATERTALQNLLNKAERDNNVTKAELNEALLKLYNSSNIELPATKQFYTLTLVGKGGEEHFLNYNGTQLELKRKQAGEDVPVSAMFVVLKQKDNALTLLTINGKYIDLRGELSEEYSATLSPLTFGKLPANEQVMLSSEQAYGLITIQSKIPGKSNEASDLRFWGGDLSKGILLDTLTKAVLNEELSVAFRLEQSAPPLGDVITQLSEVKGDKAYALYNPHFTAYAIKKEGQNNIWAAGMKGDAGHPLSNPEFGKTHNSTDPLGAWQLIKAKDGQWYLYNIGAQQYAKTSNPSIFVGKKQAIKVTPIEGGFAFSTSNGEKDFLCAAPQFSDKPLVNWTSNDAGSKWVLIENPYVDPNLQLFNTLTAIQQVQQKAAAQKGIYNLAGQRINTTSTQELPAGLYIIDGQKHIVR